MKIERFSLHHLRMPLVAPFETSFGREIERDCVLVVLQAEGLTGYGECVASHAPGYNYETTGTAWHILGEFIAPAILGADLQIDRGVSPGPCRRSAVIIWPRPASRWPCGTCSASAPAPRCAKCLAAQRAQRGGRGLGRASGVSRKSLSKSCGNTSSKGYARVKLKIKPGRDVGDTTAVRKAFPGLRLQVDANSSFTLETARALKPLDDLDLLLIEQPLFEDDIWDHRRLQREFHTPICLDESIISARHARYALEMKACRIINIKAARVGGLSEAVQVHDLCQARGNSGLVRRHAGNRRGPRLQPGAGRTARLQPARRHLGLGPLFRKGHHGRSASF